MIALLVRLILKKGLPFPVQWGIIYPLLSGHVAVTNLALGKPPLVTVESVVADIDWRSLFGDRLVVERATLANVHSAFDVGKPLGLIHCLEGGDCGNVSQCEQPTARQALGTAGKTTKKTGASVEQQKRKPLRLLIEKFTIESGSLTFCRGGEMLEVGIQMIEGRGVQLPLAAGGVALQAEVSMKSPEGSGRRYPVSAAISWNAADKTLIVDAVTADLPLAALTSLFPEISGARGGSEFKVGGQVVVQEVRENLRVSGPLRLTYQEALPRDRRWNITLP